MLSYASGQVTFRNACNTVLDLVDGISAVPVEILRSMSLAMVFNANGRTLRKLLIGPRFKNSPGSVTCSALSSAATCRERITNACDQ